MSSEIMNAMDKVRVNLASWRRVADECEQATEQLYVLLRLRDAEVVHLRAMIEHEFEHSVLDELFVDPEFPAEEVPTDRIRFVPAEEDVVGEAPADATGQAPAPVVTEGEAGAAPVPTSQELRLVAGTRSSRKSPEPV